MQHGDQVLVDLAAPVIIGHGDRLVLEDGRHAEVIAAEEDLMEACRAIRYISIELAWHIGNRHLPAQIEATRVLVAKDHVIRDMLAGLGATVREVREPFQPVHGAYHGQGHAHDTVMAARARAWSRSRSPPWAWAAAMTAEHPHDRHHGDGEHA